MLGDSDLPALFRDFGLIVTKGGQSTEGILDDGEELVLGGYAPGMNGNSLRLTVMTGAMVWAVDEALTISDRETSEVLYSAIVRERLKMDDGRLTRLRLELQ